MSRGPHTFKQRDMTRAIKAMKAAGVENCAVHVDPGGGFRVFCSDGVVTKQTPHAAKIDTTWDDDAPQATALR